MYKCIIIDDEELARLLLKDYCAKINDLEVIGCYKSPLAATEELSKKELDMLFIDINMPDILGTDFLRSLPNMPNVVLTTAYRDYAVEAFEIEVIDYLLKPIEFHRFLKAVNKVKETIAAQKSKKTTPPLLESIQIKANKKTYRVYVKDILFVKSHSEYVVYYTSSFGKLMVYGTMKSVEKVLPSNFIRIHRSYIVNVTLIDYIEGNQIIIKEERLPLGETYKENFMNNW